MAENGKFGGREVVIVEAARLPVGRGHEEKGYYKDVHASSLLAKTYSELIKRAGIDASEVEDVVAGCVQQFGEQGINIARNAWLEAGLPMETPPPRSIASAARPSRRSIWSCARRLRRPRRGDRRRRGAHGPHLLCRLGRGDEGARPGLLARAAGALQPSPAGISAEMIADKWEIPAPSSMRLGSAPIPSPTRPPRRAFRARDDPLAVERRHLRHRPGDPAPGRGLAGEARLAEAGLQGGRQDHRRQLPRRSPTAPPRSC